MGSVLTFADLYRESPQVFFAPWPEFDVLFNSANDEIRLKRSWNPGTDHADFVLHVTEAIFQEWGKGWILRPHPRNFAVMFDTHTDGWWWPKSKWEAYDAAEPWVRRMRPGGVFYFSFAPNAICKDIALMLHGKEEDQVQQESDEQPIQGEDQACAIKDMLEKPSLENLPGKLHKRIIAELPVQTAIHILPFVSKKLFSVVKGTDVWIHARLDGFYPSLRTLMWFAKRAQGTCTSLCLTDSATGGKLNPGLGNVPDFYNTLFQRMQWTCLQEVNLEGHLNGFNPNALKAGLKKGNLPGLKTLRLESEEGLSWSALAGCPLSGLVHLTISIGERVPCDQMQRFWDQFAALKTLKVVIASDTVWQYDWSNPSTIFPHPKKGAGELLPNLESLTVAGADRNPLIGPLEAELEFFQSSRVERLCLQKASEGESPGMNIVRGSWLSSTFQHLSALRLDATVCLDWQSIPKAFLQQLIHLQVVMTKSSDEIPFGSMRNLEAACVELDGEEFQEFPSLRKLMKLPKLTSLKFAHALLLSMPIGRITCSMRSLDLGETLFDADDEGVAMEELLRLCSTLPQLIRLVLPQKDGGTRARDVCRILQLLHGISYLKVPYFLCKELPEVVASFPNESWEAFLPCECLGDCERLPCRPVVFRPRHSIHELIDKALLIFEDDFFCIE